MPTAFYTNNVPRFFPMEGYTIPWPTFGSSPTEGDLVPQMNKQRDLQGHRVASFISGPTYFQALYDEMLALEQSPQGGIFWVHGWFFDLYSYEASMRFSGKTNDIPTDVQAAESGQYWHLLRNGEALEIGVNKDLFVQKILDLEAAGVDVRIIGYISPLLLQSWGLAQLSDALESIKFYRLRVDHYKAQGVQDRIYATFFNLLRLREDLVDPSRVIFNTLSHPLGGAHSKMVIIGNANYRKAFTGGIDLASVRNTPKNHDVAISVEGTATSFAARFFKDLWNEITLNTAVNIDFYARNSKSGADLVPAATYPTHLLSPMTMDIADIAATTVGATADQFVQMFTTLPRKNYEASPPTLKVAAAGALASYKLRLGLAEGRAFVRALREVRHFYTPRISFADKGRFEFKTVCYKAVDEAEDYILILDQDATNFELMRRINRRVRKLRDEGKTLRVVIGTNFLRDVQVSGRDRMITAGKQNQLFKRLAESIPTGAHKDHFLFAMVGTHAKVMLIDDKWVSIGSANCMRRSFYTDVEMGFSILHDTWVPNFRKELLQSFLDPNSSPIPDDPMAAIAVWNVNWQADFPNIDYSGFIFNSRFFLTASTPRIGTKDSFNTFRHDLEDPDSNSLI